MNAFNTTGPSTILKGVRHKNVKQLAKDANRKNPEAQLCAFVPPEKAQKLRMTTI